jgi:RNA polymerase sigma-70 factor (ECF subfamily)
MTTGIADAASPSLDFERLYEECLPAVYGFAYRMLGDRESALDAAQESFVRALAGASSFRGESAPLTWLLSIARNVCLRRMSGGRERTLADFEAAVERFGREPAPTHSEVERRVYVEEVKEGCLIGLLQCLPIGWRTAFILVLLNDVSIADAARIMGRSENSVRILVSRARSRLRAFLCENCSLLGAGGCSCSRMIEFSLDRDLIERYRPEIVVPRVRDELRRFSDEVELYRSLQDSADAIAEAMKSGRYSLFASDPSAGD